MFSLFAYIGPGAGIALFSSFLAVLVAMFSALLGLLTWPVRRIWRALRGRRALAHARVKRVVVLGLDGLDPGLVEEMLEAGELPNLAKIRQQGTYTRLGTTWPPLSPVAWSSFSTGSNPGKHNIFDFIQRRLHDYRVEMSSVRIRPPRRSLSIGKYKIPLARPRVEALRKSRPFWQELGDHGIFTAVLRVPITFPPEKFHGVQLSAMCVPDLRGTQGTFTLFCENDSARTPASGDGGGDRAPVMRNGKGVSGHLIGPDNPLRREPTQSQLRFQVVPGKIGDAVLRIAGNRVVLRPGVYSDWIQVPFRLAPGVTAHGICRFLLRQYGPPFEMYATPINIDPNRPVMPISHPPVYAVYLAKQHGPFATLGLAEDTSSLTDGAIDERAFLQQTYDIDEERQQMFFDTLRRVRQGAVVCVFDGPDRIQHMFWRFHDDQHPARGSDPAAIAEHKEVIRQMYARMDRLVGKTIDAVGDGTALIVMSDHGFKPFRRAVDLNSWLLKHGYLALKEDAVQSSTPYLEDVDWSRTRAYGLGLAGIFINQRGRESQGIVADGTEKQQLVAEICDQLTGIKDPEQDNIAIHEAVPRGRVFQGPYVDAAPDIIVGYNVGYRVSWETASGKCSGAVFADNLKAWSGDHCIHPDLVPGILFTTEKLGQTGADIMDVAPTVLELLGVPTPGYMDGHSLLCSDATSSE